MVFRRWIIFGLIIVITCTLIASEVHAANGLKDKLFGLIDAGNMAGYKTDATANVPNLVKTLINSFLALLGLIFLGLSLYAGVIWMTSRGNEEKTKEAIETIIHAAIGLALILGSYAITNFVLERLLPTTT